jgi:hypothetical protein
MKVKIHYIYWGSIPEPSNQKRFVFSAPASRVGERVETTLWCNHSLYASLAESGDVPRASPHGFVARCSPLEALYPKLVEPWRTGLGVATDFFQQHECYSALKDMWSLVVLYLFGGFYFDASTYLVGLEPSLKERDIEIRVWVAKVRESIDPRPTNQQFRPYLSSPRFPALRWPQADNEIERSGQDLHVLGPCSKRPGLTIVAPRLDYWAAYANERDPIIESMLAVYLKSVLEQKLLVPGRLNGWSLADALSKGVEKGLDAERARQVRNVTIGQLIHSAVKDGLLNCWSGLEGVQEGENLCGSAFAGLTWDAYAYKRNRNSRYIRAFVPELGLMKRYENSWQGGLLGGTGAAEEGEKEK